MAITNGEVNNMGDTGFSTNDAVLWGAMNNMGGRGSYGAWGGGGGMGAPFADLTSNAVRTQTVGQQVGDQGRFTREFLGTQVGASQQAFENLSRMNQFTTIVDGQNESERRTCDGLAAIRATIEANARANDKCCCETQKEIIRLDAANNLKFAELSKQQAVDAKTVAANQATIIAQIEANQKLNAVTAELNALKTQVACGCVSGCSTPCNNNHNHH